MSKSNALIAKYEHTGRIEIAFVCTMGRNGYISNVKYVSINGEAVHGGVANNVVWSLTYSKEWTKEKKYSDKNALSGSFAFIKVPS